jgi:hypothetical protein
MDTIKNLNLNEEIPNLEAVTSEHIEDITKTLEEKYQSRSQALSSTLLAGENTLAGAGHVPPKFWVAKSIIAVGGVVEESVCRIRKIATLCVIVSGDKNAHCNKKS